MDEQKKNHNTKVKKIIGIPRAANIAAVFAAIIIILGVAESAYMLKLNLFEITIISAVLFVFYLILLASILRPRVLKVIKVAPEKSKVPKPENKEIKTSSPVTININNQPKVPKKRKRSKKRRK